MNHGEYVHLLGERTALERMIQETPEEDVIDRKSLLSRLKAIEEELAQREREERHPARVRLTFKGRPVVGSYGIFADFGMKSVTGFADSVTAMAASLSAPLAATGPIPNKDQHQLIITSTALGSFGFDLEEQRSGQLAMNESAVAQALERIQSLLRGTQGTDDELADSAASVDRRARDKLRAFLETLADNEAVCAVRFGDEEVRFKDVGQVRTSIARLSQENLREDCEEIQGELQGVLPKARVFEFKIAATSQVIKGTIASTVRDLDALNKKLHQPLTIKVQVTKVGSGRPRYLLLEV